MMFQQATGFKTTSCCILFLLFLVNHDGSRFIHGQTTNNSTTTNNTNSTTVDTNNTTTTTTIDTDLNTTNTSNNNNNSSSTNICITTNNNTFTVKVNLFASELGYYTIEECGEDIMNPTLGLMVGETYTFVQSDKSNWMHPLGFAYYPDGAHAGLDELELSIIPPGQASLCNMTYTCPSPKYDINHEYQGIVGTSDFGLDVYEPLFFHTLPEWISYGTFTIRLPIPTDEFVDYEQDLFYFCHIHQYMSGRIKLLDTSGNLLNPDSDVPVIDYKYDTISEFDATCGTHGLDTFQLPNAFCPDRFVCYNGENDEDTSVATTTRTSDTTTTSTTSSSSSSSSIRGDGTIEKETYASCIDAMNCHMLVGMTTGIEVRSEIGLFIEQMIPHHQNAVNMAKNLLRLQQQQPNSDVLNCTDLMNEKDNPNCQMEIILRDIINGQNHEIQMMRGVLDAKNITTPSPKCSNEIYTLSGPFFPDQPQSPGQPTTTITTTGGDATTPTTSPQSAPAPSTSGGRTTRSKVSVVSALCLGIVGFMFL